MPSSKGEPTDPELREKIKEEVKAETKGTIDCSMSFSLQLNPNCGSYLIGGV